MATRNDYKILAKQCEIQFQLAKKTLTTKSKKIDSLSPENIERFGFYYYILQNVLNLTDYNEMTDCITDCDFNVKLFDINDSDDGIDAGYIDEETTTIHLFNFKYRNEFNPDKTQSINESILSSKFFNVLNTENNTLTGKLKKLADDIISKQSSKTAWDIKFYIVSNENRTLNKYTTPDLLNMEKTYEIDIVTIGLTEIKDYMSIRPSEINAKVSLPAESVMSYTEGVLSSDVSYIVNMPLADLIRITSTNLSLREEYNLEDETRLSSVDFETNVLFDNVRSYILRSKFNANIKQTLKDDYSRFFLYNNGVTIVASDISTKSINSGKRLILGIKNFQVLNGGQTLRSIHDFNKENDQHITKLSSSCVLVRVLKVTDADLKNRISEYTNSQNAISTIDLKSMRTEQLQLDAFLKGYDILYIRKSGVMYEDITKYKHQIDIQTLGQILFARAGYPDKVSNRKREIFSNRYDELFANNPNLLSQATVDAIVEYYNIKTVYGGTTYTYYEQKAFYILYLAYALQRNDYNQLIDEYERFLLSNQPTNERLSRTLVRPSFKESLKQHFCI